MGCQEYDWQWTFQSPDDIRVIEEQARAKDQHVFIFYKWLFDGPSSRMEWDVLSAPEIKSQFQDTVNVLIDKESGRPYVEYVGKYGVTSYPAVIIVAPDGTYEKQLGFVPKEQFLEFIAKAKNPAPAKPKPEPKP